MGVAGRQDPLQGASGDPQKIRGIRAPLGGACWIRMQTWAQLWPVVMCRLGLEAASQPKPAVESQARPGPSAQL